MKTFPFKYTICVLSLVAFFAFDSKSQTPIAYYPLTTNSTDVTGNFGALVYGTAATQPPTGACSNGTSSSMISTPSLASLFNKANFAVSTTFTANSYAANSGQPRPIFVIDNLYRAFGVIVGNTGLIGVLYNNSNYVFSTTTLTLGQSYTMLVKYVTPFVELTLNDNLILSSNVGTIQFSPQSQSSNYALYTYNGGNGQAANGCISNLRIFSSNVLLPVKLLSFTAAYEKSDRVSLRWKTASEDNGNKFEIERSSDGNQWSTIGVVPGRINTSTTKEYEFIDEHPIYGVDNYYRLRQVDVSGETNFSSIQKVQPLKSAVSVVLYPNPTHDKIRLMNYRTSQISIHEYTTGRTVLLPTTVNGVVDVQSLSSGMYYIRLVRNSEIQCIPFQKK